MQSNSGTTTIQSKPDTVIGMQLGGRGLATLIGSSRPQHATPDLAADILLSSLVFSAQLPESIEEANAVADAVDYLSTPAPRKWIAGRVLTLLSQYFAPNMDEGVTSGIADDWCAMLDRYPAWAIANACRWWMSRENPEKKRRPLPGDIQERAYVEMTQLRAAKITLGRGIAKPTPAQSPERPPISDEARARNAEYAAGFIGKFRAMPRAGIDGGDA